ncbi:hypothetical protein D3C78_1866820 [compost metagenome]
MKTIQEEGQTLLDKAVKDQAEKKQKGDSGEESAGSSNQDGASAEVITITK